MLGSFVQEHGAFGGVGGRSGEIVGSAWEYIGARGLCWQAVRGSGLLRGLWVAIRDRVCVEQQMANIMLLVSSMSSCLAASSPSTPVSPLRRA